MAYEVKDNTGFLYNNKNRTSDKHPLLKGYLIWKGERIQIAAWLRQDKDGTDMFSLAAEETRQQAENPRPQYQPKPAQVPPTPPIFTQYKKPAGEPLPKHLPEHDVDKQLFNSKTGEELPDDQFDPDDIPF